MKYYYLLIAFAFYACQNESSSEDKPLNILMIAVDDLRPTIGAYGDPLVKTPNIDHLASESVLFAKAFCSVPTCGASRASLLTSTRPTRYRFLTHKAISQEQVPDAIAINEYLKANGYHTISNGKIFHNLNDRAAGWDDNWRLQSDGNWRDYQIPENDSLDSGDQRGPAYERAEVHDTVYRDGKLMLKTIKDLEQLKDSGQPFFLATGFVKPHLPFNAPAKYWDLYDRSDFEPSRQEFWPANAPRKAFHNSGELRNYHGIPQEGFVSDSLSVTLQHGYHAAISYTDALIGHILEKLDELDLRKTTIIVLWGDHGWQLGEHGLWNKHCNFNTSLHAPLLISVPGGLQGVKTQSIAEFIDIYPTIVDLVGLKIPRTAEGKSLAPILENPDQGAENFAISKWQDGLTIRTQQYAYTEFRTDEDSLISRMLYDHNTDPEESDNIVDEPQYQSVIDSLSSIMMANRGKDYFTNWKMDSEEI
ncbi:sulfatase [Portibacter marinus]|uniref:sulfatase n=1 Tax=Portibacter marinus TaxID=2898660 RepID=UPI001F195E2B|nr:sulfatase [Portibacter marinus]